MIRYKTKPDTEENIKELLIPEIKEWFFKKFKNFSEPQLYGILEVYKRNNILLSAPTGTGKTLTIMLSILNELIDSAKKGILENRVYCVYISPLKALSRDIQRNLIEPLKEIEELNNEKYGIRVLIRTGDSTQAEKVNMLKNPPHILITTPESLALMLTSYKFRDHLKSVDWCCIDETHALAENKRGTHLVLSLERLQNISPGICRIGASATISPLSEIAKFLVGTNRDCIIVDVQYLKKFDLKVVSPVNDLVNTSYQEIFNKMYNLIHELIQEHKTTLIFTNTRAGTESVVHNLKEKFPEDYNESNISAHHGSLSKELRFNTEDNLKLGKTLVCVSSTSLELGLDIGYIDLVICIGSPKSVARALQRLGRSNHQVEGITNGKIIVTDRDDLVECSCLLKDALEKKIDRIHIPNNCLDVLAQQIVGMSLEQVWDERELFKIIKNAHPYRDLSYKDYEDILKYLSGEYLSLEERNVYGKIWRNDGSLGKKGRLARVIYMTNIGTIPDQTGIKVKLNDFIIGTIDEAFLEKLKVGDIFVLGGSTYEFRSARGMSVTVRSAVGRLPTVPRWFSDNLPLSFDLAMQIQTFRKLMEEKMSLSKKEVLDFINSYLYVDEIAAEAIYNYFRVQYDYLTIPHKTKIVIENYIDERGKLYVIFHTLFGRRVNDCLSRSIAFIVARTQNRDIEVGISDNGFYLSSTKKINGLNALKLLKSKELEDILRLAIDKSEILRRRFRHCAGRALMILRSYKGNIKTVGRQQVSSMILLSAVRSISEDFPILKEARREILNDLMDLENAIDIVRLIENEKIKVKEMNTLVPSPFGIHLVLQGYSDILKIEERHEFLKRMHEYVQLKISMKK